MATKPLPVHGADISHHQASVDLRKAKAAGLDWLYHKATQGKGFVDSKFEQRRVFAREIGLPFGAYHFAETTSPPEVQAAHFLKVAKIVPGDMRPMLDLEDTTGSRFSAMTTAARTKWVGRFVAVVKKATGVEPFIYTPFDLSDHFGCPLWVARYNPRNEPPHVPKPWKNYTIRQFTNGITGVPKSFPGLGNVDLNCWNGDPKKMLKTFTIPPKAAPAPTPPKPPVPAPPKPPVKTLAVLADEVIAGKWGSGDDRVKRLTAAGYDAKAVQAEVNRRFQTPPPPPPPVKRKTATLRVSTANIQNFPDMTDAKVRADVKTALGVSDLVLWQEIGDTSDHKAINDLDAGFATTQVKVETPITGRLSLLKPVGEPIVTKISEGLGKGSFSPARWMTEQRWTWATPTDLPDVHSICIHYVQQAWGPKKPAKIPERRRQWNQSHDAHKKAALTALGHGLIVVGGGDFNRRIEDVPTFHPSQRWMPGAPKAIDGAYVLTPSSVKSTFGTQIVRNINGDHHLRTALLTVSR